ncbi:hypothetical protein N656DRAFT_136383 [Canariomyces notabilis]|uniref:Uncharacterized protein n=1 Tax=Canariomyces notabilis TaxID=2074819 RepID=A0AAN6TD26_9PEZI|nr:hypothetical protein N656DRAFT_136383 [Canariomyces arenarius]
MERGPIRACRLRYMTLSAQHCESASRRAARLVTWPRLARGGTKYEGAENCLSYFVHSSKLHMYCLSYPTLDAVIADPVWRLCSSRDIHSQETCSSVRYEADGGRRRKCVGSLLGWKFRQDTLERQGSRRPLHKSALTPGKVAGHPRIYPITLQISTTQERPRLGESRGGSMWITSKVHSDMVLNSEYLYLKGCWSPILCWYCTMMAVKLCGCLS